MAVGELWLDCNYDEAGKLVYDQDSHRQASMRAREDIAVRLRSELRHPAENAAL